MKLCRLGSMLSLCAVALVGCESTEGEAGGEAEGTAAAQGAPAGEQPAGEGAAAPSEEQPGPAAVCAKLLESIKAKDAGAVGGMSTEGAAEMMTPEVMEALAGELGAATCGEEMVEGDKATVKATAGDQTRDIPFAKVDGAWKFDAKAYAEKYPAKGKKGKKEKAKKGKKAKGKKGK